MGGMHLEFSSSCLLVQKFLKGGVGEQCRGTLEINIGEGFSIYILGGGDKATLGLSKTVTKCYSGLFIYFCSYSN